ncbi:MAG: N-6 DNA methylase, partial [Zoogloeaceae bacterium]|nr:N-6 DNA methylase [Zoogloeaceae bacterium]
MTTQTGPHPLRRFAKALFEKFSVHVDGEPEDQLRAPFEQLLMEAGAALGFPDVVPVGETLLVDGGGRPDYGVAVSKLLCGHVELKAPGKGANTSLFKGHDMAQWKRFCNLPNVLYSDGREFALYRNGQRLRAMTLPQNPLAAGAAAVDDESARRFDGLLHDFFSWEPIVPGNAKQLVDYLAPLCRYLRDDVLDALRHRVPAVETVKADWGRYLFPGVDDAHFADAYAQTVMFSLLLARSSGADTLVLDEAVAKLTHANSLLSRALKVLTDSLVQERLGVALDLLMRVIKRVPTGTMSGGRRDSWLNFYEDFLAEYDPALRRDVGVYYTPVEVVKAQVCLVDDLLRRKMDKPLGFATGGVNVLDPAVGTGTYLLGIVEHALESVREVEGPGAVPARADLLGGNLYGFEIMVGPYAVSSLRLTRMLQQHGGHLPGDGVQIMLNNTLESPHEKIPELPLLYQPIGLEHKRARRVKETVPILVCIGNPPYDRHAAATRDKLAVTGGWVRWGENKNGTDAILDDFIVPVKKAGKGSRLSNLYNLYVYFWRWALWKTFEHDLAIGPGVVSFITASSFVDGDAFLGMREYMRRLCDEIWVIDLGGEGRGARQDDNVFAIQTPVAITIAVRYGDSQKDTPAHVYYARVEGTRAEKLHQLENLQALTDLPFDVCAKDWHSPFRPVGKGDYFDWPLFKNLMPWQHAGVKPARTWPIGPTREILAKRWQGLLAASDRAGNFRESDDRLVTNKYPQFHPSTTDTTPISELDVSTECPAAQAYGFRSFDRQFILPDGRLLSRPRQPLWQSASDQQLFFASQFTHPLGNGPALTVSALVPDLHFFAGRGAKDIVPLYRDAAATQPNLHPELLRTLAKIYARKVTPQDFAAYLYALLAQPAFTARFARELDSRELRAPITKDAALFKRAVGLGSELLFLHTCGERFKDDRKWPAAT